MPRCFMLCAAVMVSAVSAIAQFPHTVLGTPQINGSSVYGERPSHPFLYRIPATGDRPIHYRADGLPKGLKLSGTTGIISGSAEARGSFDVTLIATNRLGRATREFHIIIGDRLALAPPMGWSAWDLLQTKASDQEVRRQADALITTGLADHGYSYINLDDGWNVQMVGGDPNPKPRDSEGNLIPNERFPDMKGLTDYLHNRGLKAGIYTSPGPLTCARFAGSYGHEQQDAQQFARWGFDLLKYDLCSYKPKDESLSALQEPYRNMGTILAGLDRDVLFSLCQYGKGDVWKWGSDVGGSMWRATGDIGWGPKGDYSAWDNIVADFNQPDESQFIGPGKWEDLDYLFLGHVAFVFSNSHPPNAKVDRVQPTPLTPDEQYTHMTLWSLLASPLIIGGDLTTMDSFTLSLLTNDEVIAIDQDPLGRQAVRVAVHGNISVWEKELEDGSEAVGVFNLGDREEDASVAWTELELQGPYEVRDLWRRKDLGRHDGSFQTRVPPHGVVLMKISKISE